MFGRVVNFFLWAIRLPRIFPSSPTESSKGLTEPEDEGEAVAPQSNQDVSVGFFVSLACFLVFQTVFTVFVKITGDVYGSDFAFFDTQLMNIVYAGLCLPFFFVSLALRATCVMQRTPTWLHGLRLREYPGGAREWFMEQGWIMVTSVVDAFASFLYGIGGNGSTGTFQSLVSNFGPFFLQLVVYVAYSRQRKTRKALWQQDSRWRYSSVISLLGLMGSLFLTVYTPSSTSYPNGGVGYTCSIVSFLLAAVCTTISWHVKEHLYVTYNTDAIYLNTCNALHMVWLTFPLFLLQTRVPQSWTSCTASGTIGHNFEDGWKCMRRTLRDSTGDGFADGCSSAGWSEWIYAISTWLAGMGQFAFTRYAKSSAFQFLFTIATAALSTCFFWVAPSSWLQGGIHVAALPYNVFGLVVCLLLTMVFSACERDVMEEQATTEGTRLNVSDAQGNHAALLNA